MGRDATTDPLRIAYDYAWYMAVLNLRAWQWLYQAIEANERYRSFVGSLLGIGVEHRDGERYVLLHALDELEVAREVARELLKNLEPLETHNGYLRWSLSEASAVLARVGRESLAHDLGEHLNRLGGEITESEAEEIYIGGGEATDPSLSVDDTPPTAFPPPPSTIDAAVTKIAEEIAASMSERPEWLRSARRKVHRTAWFSGWK